MLITLENTVGMEKSITEGTISSALCMNMGRFRSQKVHMEPKSKLLQSIIDLKLEELYVAGAT
jgi:hypothetical protein